MLNRNKGINENVSQLPILMEYIIIGIYFLSLRITILFRVRECNKQQHLNVNNDFLLHHCDLL